MNVPLLAGAVPVHCGREGDRVSSVEVLPEIARAVGTRLTILVDGGFRRGTQVAKALALRANAVMLIIGRPTLCGLAAGGEEGVERALAILTSELDRVLGQLGCSSVAELDSRFILPA